MECFLRFIISLILISFGYWIGKNQYKRATRPLYRPCDDWIPVSKEEIPQIENDILITYSTPFNDTTVTTTHSISYDKEGNPLYISRYKITAWMPIPSPYKGQ